MLELGVEVGRARPCAEFPACARIHTHNVEDMGLHSPGSGLVKACKRPVSLGSQSGRCTSRSVPPLPLGPAPLLGAAPMVGPAPFSLGPALSGRPRPSLRCSPSAPPLAAAAGD